MINDKGIFIKNVTIDSSILKKQIIFCHFGKNA